MSLMNRINAMAAPEPLAKTHEMTIPTRAPMPTRPQGKGGSQPTPGKGGAQMGPSRGSGKGMGYMPPSMNAPAQQPPGKGGARSRPQMPGPYEPPGVGAGKGGPQQPPMRQPGGKGMAMRPPMGGDNAPGGAGRMPIQQFRQQPGIAGSYPPQGKGGAQQTPGKGGSQPTPGKGGVQQPRSSLGGPRAITGGPPPPRPEPMREFYPGQKANIQELSRGYSARGMDGPA